MFYTLKRVPRKELNFRDDIEHDVFLECFFGTENDGITPKLSDEWDSKNTTYWAGNTSFTKTKFNIKYSNDIQKIKNARNYNIKHNEIKGSYIGIVEVTLNENGNVERIGEEVYL